MYYRYFNIIEKKILNIPILFHNIKPNRIIQVPIYIL